VVVLSGRGGHRPSRLPPSEKQAWIKASIELLVGQWPAYSVTTDLRIPGLTSDVRSRSLSGPSLSARPMSANDPMRMPKLCQSVIAKFAGVMPDLTVGVMSDWCWTSI